MLARLNAAPFDFEVLLYTADGTYWQPAGWEIDGDVATATDLVNGSDGEAITAADAALTVRFEPVDAHTVALQVQARHPDAVKGIKLALDLPAMRMLAPEEVALPEATWREWHFPRDWRTGFAVWQGEQRDFTVCTRDFPWHFKRLRALRTGDRMRLEIIQDANVRERSLDFESTRWEIGYRDDVDALLDDYAGFVRQAFGAGDFLQRQDMPEWTRGLGLVVNLHGTDWNGQANLDFAGMTAAAEELAQRFPAERTLLSPIGWEGRYMRDYPPFEPPPGLGGAAGFKHFCATARQLGFHIMPHLNAMVCNMRNRLYLTHLKNYVIRNHLNQPVHCLHIDWDHDGLGDPAHSYLALQPRALRDVLVAVIDGLITQFGIDAVFLDETCNVFYNDPAWDQVDGVRRLVRDLHYAFPDVLIVGEEWNETLLGLTPVVQIWEETADQRGGFGREKSPLVRRWAGRFIRSCGYLALASPDGHTGVHEWPDKPWVDEQDNEAYYLPTLSLTRDSVAAGMAGIEATVRRAENYVREFVQQPA